MHLINSSKRLTGLAAIACAAALTPVAALAATATMTGYTGKDISGEINHGDIRFTAIVSLR